MCNDGMKLINAVEMIISKMLHMQQQYINTGLKSKITYQNSLFHEVMTAGKKDTDTYSICGAPGASTTHLFMPSQRSRMVYLTT